MGEVGVVWGEREEKMGGLVVGVMMLWLVRGWVQDRFSENHSHTGGGGVGVGGNGRRWGVSEE